MLLIGVYRFIVEMWPPKWLVDYACEEVDQLLWATG